MSQGDAISGLRRCRCAAHSVQATATNLCWPLYNLVSREGTLSVREGERWCRVLRQPSQIVQTTLPRPLGIIFEEDARQKRAVISGFMDGSPAAQLAQVHAGCRMHTHVTVADSRLRLHEPSHRTSGSARLCPDCVACHLPPAPECVPASVLYRVGLSSPDPPCPPLQRARLDRSQAAGAPAVGDVLRACTCTTFVFPTNSLFGAKPPQRHIVCYGADQQKWTQVQPLCMLCMLQTSISELWCEAFGALLCRCAANRCQQVFRHNRAERSDVQRQPVCRS